MKTLLLRVTMVGVLFLGVMILGHPAAVRASGCNTSIRCFPPKAPSLGFCAADCYCNFSNGTRKFDPIDCTPE